MSVCVKGDVIKREISNSYKVSFISTLEYKKLKINVLFEDSPQNTRFL